MLMRTSLACSFCGTSAAQVEKRVAGPQVFICNECVATATRILRAPGGTAPPARTLVSPTCWRWLARRMPWPRVSRHERAGRSAGLGPCVRACGPPHHALGRPRRRALREGHGRVEDREPVALGTVGMRRRTWCGALARTYDHQPGGRKRQCKNGPRRSY
jgi:hypothetical protein